MVTYFITLISQLLSLINSTNHIWLPPIVTFIVIKLICHRHFRRPRLLYRPSHALQTTPESHNLHYEEVWIPVVQDKQPSPEHIHSWWLPKT
ncbi:hypothetical protein Lepto7375DRAFT_6055 [Leptolyngbya sp. PCC 7375]|nr:hypothetical protein Lepto7375DRAFT_6055 [Leptolyngbya sp. PCC 7375]